MRVCLKISGSDVVIDDMLGARASGNDVLVHTTPKGLARLENIVTRPMAVTSQNLTTLWVRIFGCKIGG